METRSNQVLVGSITLGLLGALVLFVIWLSQVSGAGEKKYDIFFQQSVEGLAKGTSVTFSGVPVGQIESINLVPDSPQFIRVRINVNGDTPVLEGSTATIRGVGFTGVSQIQIDPPPAPRPGQSPRPRREIRCPEQNAQSECPYGVPIIPTRPGALTSLLNTAPELLERVSTLTERLTELLSDRNQESIAGILDNLQQISRSLAERSPEIAAALAEARVAIRQAGEAADRIGQLASSTTQLIDRDGRPLIADLRSTMRSAQGSLAQLEAAIGDARPGLQAFSNQTLPEVGQLMRDLRASSESLREITDRLNQQGVGGVIGGQRLPNYRPGRRN
ncbi:MAG: phospholipid/cholesterol/gamma-HCH transport system substrate-binding protein [Sphingomonadales bacterium]|jgi:phospholipid/cholesterol/gamma-HCH transport system substrate-binding protein|nr:phospholipid/cholesterol/gamma-HCH transport system substrate-binding protein [Sphingomonadales bacterium]